MSLMAWYQVTYRRRDLLLSRIPAPKKLPLLHNAMEFYGKTPQQVFHWLQEMNKKLGPVYHFTFSPFHDGSVQISDPKIAEAILSSQKILDKAFDYDMMKGWLGIGLLLSSGKKWHQRRKILTPAFHFQILEKFVEIMDEQAKVLVAKLAKIEEKEVDTVPLLSLFALDVICGVWKYL